MLKRILIVEDDPAIRTLISVNMMHAGFGVIEAEDGEKAWLLITESLPDLVVIDWMLPGMSGFHLLRHIRSNARTRQLPLLMLTARCEEVDKITALGAGIDDYMTKPFSPKELVARVRALLRGRQRGHALENVELAGLRLVPNSWEVSARGCSFPLGPTEFRLLHFLMRNPERIYSRSQLIERVWGHAAAIEERSVDVHIRRLRSALSAHRFDIHLRTVHGVGYCFSAQIAN